HDVADMDLDSAFGNAEFPGDALVDFSFANPFRDGPLALGQSEIGHLVVGIVIADMLEIIGNDALWKENAAGQHDADGGDQHVDLDRGRDEAAQALRDGLYGGLYVPRLGDDQHRRIVVAPDLIDLVHGPLIGQRRFFCVEQHDVHMRYLVEVLAVGQAEDQEIAGALTQRIGKALTTEGHGIDQHDADFVLGRLLADQEWIRVFWRTRVLGFDAHHKSPLLTG